MSKQILSEELRRMRVLAGIISESDSYEGAPDNTELDDKEIRAAAVAGFKELKSKAPQISQSIDNVSPEEVEKLKSFLTDKIGKPFESINFTDLENLAKAETESLEEGAMDVVRSIGKSIGALGIGSSLVGSIYTLYNTVGLPFINNLVANSNDASGQAYFATLLFYSAVALLSGQIFYRSKYPKE